ncbi:hypothetical protein BDC45DRAFT_539113 [Circinella umbellata]|nr:hypothetical protein BDC45DRAFT_539113 [Circinella umbellata]
MVNGVKNAKVIHSFGAWKLRKIKFYRNFPIKGYRRKSSKKVQAAAKQCEHDKVIEVDEYLSSAVCPYCFQRLSNHIYRRDDKLVKINGAKTFVLPIVGFLPGKPVPCWCHHDGALTTTTHLIECFHLRADTATIDPISFVLNKLHKKPPKEQRHQQYWNRIWPQLCEALYKIDFNCHPN